MNCKQVQGLLPLYVGHDLAERRERLVTTHLQTCAACAAEAEGYRETGQLLQDFAPPAFSEGVYAGVRRRVMREIESKSTAPALPQFVAGLFRPRVAWAVATALLVVISVVGAYLIANRITGGQQVAGGNQKAPQEQPDGRSKNNNSAVPFSPPTEGGKGLRPMVVRQPRRKSYRNVPDPTGSVTANARDARSTDAKVSAQTNNLAEPSLLPVRDSATSEKTLRVEMQTKDPNIRIIWFSSQPKQSSPSSKGI